MPRYLALLDYIEESSINGTIVTVDAFSDMDAFDALCSQHGGDANITVLGTCEEVSKLALDREQEHAADYITASYGEKRGR